MVALKVRESRRRFHGEPKAIAELVKGARSDIIETDRSVSEYGMAPSRFLLSLGILCEPKLLSKLKKCCRRPRLYSARRASMKFEWKTSRLPPGLAKAPSTAISAIKRIYTWLSWNVPPSKCTIGWSV